MTDKTTSKIQALKDADSLRFMASLFASGKRIIAVFDYSQFEIIGYKKINNHHHWILDNDHLLPFVDLKEYRIDSAYFEVESYINQTKQP